MNLNMMNEAFKRKYSNTLTESVNDTDKEQLRKALVLRSMNVVANGGNIKSLEIALQDVIENFYPDHCWWEVTDCQIFNELLGGCNPRQICDMIVDQLKPEFAENAEVEEALIEGTSETKLATNSKGDYLVAASSGKGYTVFNSSDVCIGGFDGDSDDEAKQKFQSGKLSEAIEECFTSYVVEELNKHLSRLNESEISPEDQRDSDLIRSMIDKIGKRSNAKFTPEEQGVMQKYGINRNNWQRQLSVGGRSLHPEYDGKTRKVYDGYYDFTGRTVSNGSVSKINYADRARKLPQRTDNQVGGAWRPNGSINAHTNASNSTLQDVERAVQAEQDRQPVEDMKHALWDRKYHTRQADSAIQKYDDAVAKAQAEYNHQIDNAKKWRDRDIEYGNAGRKRAQDKIDTLLRRK